MGPANRDRRRRFHCVGMEEIKAGYFSFSLRRRRLLLLLGAAATAKSAVNKFGASERAERSAPTAAVGSSLFAVARASFFLSLTEDSLHYPVVCSSLEHINDVPKSQQQQLNEMR